MEKPTFTKVSLSDVRVIMAIMRVHVVELLCQTAMGWIPVLKYFLLGACGRLWPCSIMPRIKCRRFLRSQLQWRLPGTESPWVRLLRAQACAKLGDADLQWADE
jgi:hypothetical protein